MCTYIKMCFFIIVIKPQTAHHFSDFIDWAKCLLG